MTNVTIINKRKMTLNTKVRLICNEQRLNHANAVFITTTIHVLYISDDTNAKQTDRETPMETIEQNICTHREE